jgi:hypothetical protein
VTNGSGYGSGRPKTYRTDLDSDPDAEPDPQHRLKLMVGLRKYFIIGVVSQYLLFAAQTLVKFGLRDCLSKSVNLVCRRDGPTAAHREPRPSQDREGRPPGEQGQRTGTALPPPQRLQADTYTPQLIQSTSVQGLRIRGIHLIRIRIQCGSRGFLMTKNVKKFTAENFFF